MWIKQTCGGMEKPKTKYKDNNPRVQVLVSWKKIHTTLALFLNIKMQ